MIKLNVRATQRFVIDPNQRSRMHPDWVPADISPTQQVAVGDRVLAVQPEQGEPDYIGDAWVKRVDKDFGIVFLQPDWDSFHEESHADNLAGSSAQFSFMIDRQPQRASWSSGSLVGGRFAAS